MQRRIALRNLLNTSFAWLVGRRTVETEGYGAAFDAQGATAMPDGVYSVKDYGAVGDGVADDTRAIQAAIDERNAAQNGVAGVGAVYLPPGRYRITRSLILSGSGAFSLAGAGVSSRLVNQAPAGTPALL